MIRSRLVTAALLASLSMSALATDFTPYEGKDAIKEGVGGEKKTVDGVDFWSNGAPPRKFKLLGFVTDKRHKTGLIGMARMAGLESAIAKAAKNAGGDAVILVGAEAETVGYVGQAQTNAQDSHAWINAQSAAVQKQLSRYAVIQYLPDDSPAEQPATPVQ